MQPTEDHKKKTVKLDHLNYATEEDVGLWPTFWRGLGLVVQASGQDLRNLALVNVITAWGPAVSLFFSKVIIDEVARILKGGGVTDAWAVLWQEPLLLWGIGLTLGLNFLSDALDILETMSFIALRDRVEGFVKRQVLEKLAYFNDVALFEIPDLLNLVQLVEKGIPRLQQLASILALTLFGLFRLVPSIILAASIGLWVLVTLLAFSIPSIAVELHYRKRNWHTEKLQAGPNREMRLYEQIIKGEDYAKEMRLFSLQGVMLNHWQDLWQTVFEKMQKVRREGMYYISFWSSVSGIGTAIPYVYIILGVMEGNYTLGDLALYTGIILQLRQSLFIIISQSGEIYNVLLAAQPVFQLLDLQPQLLNGDRPFPGLEHGLDPSLGGATQTDTGAPPQPSPDHLAEATTRAGTGAPSRSNLGWHDRPFPGIQIQDLSFTYPGATKPTLERVNLLINPGEMVAIVGENGAGKTTLAKLLCRLYDPQWGSIYWNGVDLREIELQELRSRITVLMQDYARFPNSLRANVAWGSLAHEAEDELLLQALRDAGLGYLPETLEQGLETPLGKQLEKGMDLSGGQWQRVAIARALMRLNGGELLVFDEPTAALDPKNEHEIYRIFQTLAKGRMTLVISHRLALAKLADRIVVMEQGQVQEEGSHGELMDLGGIYHTMFTRQASSYL
ncbi:MAG: ABC transporter ATP-binding protein [Prochlorothrix sp.]